MTTITIDGRSFHPTIIRTTVSTDCTLDQEKHTYIDYFFEENGKKHFARQNVTFDGKETYTVDEDTETEWYVEE